MDGICPLCEEKGDIGVRCGAKLCTKRGYHFIPTKDHKITSAHLGEEGGLEDPLIGLVISKYLLVRKLGQGGMGAVYIALQQPLMREVALKLILNLGRDDLSSQRFEREARATALLNHPNIVKLHDFGVDTIGKSKHLPFMVQELVEGNTTLTDLMKRFSTTGKRMPAQVVSTIFGQLLDALQAAHNKNLIHRDIKPDNIMIERVTGNPYLVKILDFGLAKAVEGMSMGGVGGLTQTGVALGTPMYMAPEQIFGAGPNDRPLDHRADLYAVGVMLFHVYTGKSPFPGRTVKEIISKKMSPTYDPLSVVDMSRYPEPWVRFFKTALSRDMMTRFSSAREMKLALDELLAGPGKPVAAAVPTDDHVPETEMFDSREFLGVGAGTGRSGADVVDYPELIDEISGSQKGAGLKVAVIITALLVVLAVGGYFVVKAFQGDAPEKKEIATSIVLDTAEPPEVVSKKIVAVKMHIPTKLPEVITPKVPENLASLAVTATGPGLLLVGEGVAESTTAKVAPIKHVVKKKPIKKTTVKSIKKPTIKEKKNDLRL